MSDGLPEKRVVAYYPGGKSAELDELPLAWLWDEYPLAPGSWGNIQAFYDGADSRPLIRKWIDRSTPVANPLPIYRPAVAPLPSFCADGGARQCYAPTEADIERVRRLFPDHPRPEAPPWYEVARRLIQAGHKQTELVVTQAPVLLELLEQGAPPTPQSLGASEAGSNSNSKTVRPKRSTVRGEAPIKLKSALTGHHEYANGDCENWEPIGCNELARLAGVAPSTASDFFDEVFDRRPADFTGYEWYRALCYNNHPELVRILKRLNDEYSPEKQYGVIPPGEDDRED